MIQGTVQLPLHKFIKRYMTLINNVTNNIIIINLYKTFNNWLLSFKDYLFALKIKAIR